MTNNYIADGLTILLASVNALDDVLRTLRRCLLSFLAGWEEDAALSQNGQGQGDIVTPPWPSPSMGNGHCPGSCKLWALRPRAMVAARLCSKRSTMGFLHATVQVPALWSCL